MHFAIRDLELDHLLVVHAGPASLRARRPDHRHRRSGTLTAEIDRSYEAYKALPLDTEDEWGNLADFLDATRTT